MSSLPVPDPPLGFRRSSLALGLSRVRALQSPAAALGLGFALVVLIAVADLLTGYEIRLSILYLIPISLVTWLAGPRWGLAASACAGATWVLTNHSSHTYSHHFYFYWEAAALVVTFVVVVLLLARLREALERSDARFVRALEGLPQAVCVTDRETGRVLLSNRRYEELTRGGGGPLERRLLTRTSFTQADRKGRELRDPTTERWYLVEAVPLRWLDGRDAALASFTDVTESKQAQQLREQEAAAMDRAARAIALSDLASTLAHELNQPLVAIAAYSEGCLRMLDSGEWEDAELAEAIERCHRQATRAGDIIKRMREFVRRHEPAREPRGINDIVRGALRLVASDLRDVAVAVELANPLPEVAADGFMIEQVLLNLVRNGAEAMRDLASRDRRLEVSTALADAGAVAISVRDHGPGLAPEAGRRLFEPFFTTKADGLGLGLALCRSIVEAHGGTLAHEPAAGGGAVFRFTLPAARR